MFCYTIVTHTCAKQLCVPSCACIVGALSAGAVIESGDNANGNYVRFADGTQVCWLSNGAAIAQSAVYKTTEWTFPAQFSDGDIVVAGVTKSADNYGFFLASYTVSEGAEVSLWWYCNHQGYINTIQVCCLAIGKWK